MSLFYRNKYNPIYIYNVVLCRIRKLFLMKCMRKFVMEFLYCQYIISIMHSSSASSSFSTTSSTAAGGAGVSKLHPVFTAAVGGGNKNASQQTTVAEKNKSAPSSAAAAVAITNKLHPVFINAVSNKNTSISTNTKVPVQSASNTTSKPKSTSTNVVEKTFEPSVNNDKSESKTSTAAVVKKISTAVERNTLKTSTAVSEKSQLKPRRTVADQGSVGHWKVSTRFARAVERWIEQRELNGVVTSKTIIKRGGVSRAQKREQFWEQIKYDLKCRNMLATDGWFDVYGERTKYHPDGVSGRTNEQLTVQVIEETTNEPTRIDIQAAMDLVPE